MDKALDEIGKLRNEMKVGFIELENQMGSNTENVIDTMEKFSINVEKGFIAIEDALGQDLSEISKKSIRSRKD